MTEWRVTARTVDGEVLRDEVELPSRDRVVAHLRERGLIPVSIREKPTEFSFTLGSGVGTRELVVMTRQFATMVQSGLPLVQALEILIDQTDNDRLAETLGSVLYHVESGATLAEGLRRNDDVFSPLYVNMVEAGEAGGVLDTILDRLATFLEKNEELTRKVKGAMIYPATIVLVAIGAIALLMIFVIPTFQDMFASFDQTMPLPTQMVLATSNFLRSNILPIVGGGALVGVAVWRWLQTDTGRLYFDRFLLNLPIIGDLARKSAIARFTRTLGTLLNSGVAILEGLEITARTSGNEVVKRAVMESRESIAGGEPIAEPLAETDVFPPMVTQMIHVGEETGSLDEMLDKVADFYEDEVDVAVESLLKAIEPAMMVILGVIVGAIIISMYLPIFNIITSVQAA